MKRHSITCKSISKSSRVKGCRCRKCNKLHTNPPTSLCDSCITLLDNELDQLKDNTINFLAFADSWELSMIAEDIKMEFDAILKKYHIKDSFQLEDILNN